MDEIERLSDRELIERLDALRAEELRRLGIFGQDPKRAQFFQETERLASLGVLARGLAHEFNNLFSGVIAHCDYALQSGDDAARVQALEVALGSTRKASVLVKSIQRFARQERGRLRRADPVELVNRTLQLVGPALKTHKVQVRTALEPVEPFVMDQAAIQEVILNLLTNAMQASAAGGAVEVGARQQGDLCTIWVRDEGAGIPEEDLPRLFTPFFSTKGVYARNEADRRVQGTGLGLAASFGIIRQHGGTIEVESRAGAGSCFRVKLPMRRRPSASGERAGAAAEPEKPTRDAGRPG